MARIIVRIKGGLGNQLFCYAAGRRLATINNCELVIDDVSGFSRDKAYRRKYMLDRFQITARRATAWERMEPLERYRRGWAKIVARRRPFPLRHYVEQEGIDFDPRLLALKVKDAVYLDGLWQSEGYFKDVEDTIRKELTIIPPEDAPNREMAKQISQCSAVAVHVRWFDLPGSGRAPHNISTDYYLRAIDEVCRNVSNPHFFLFSDDPHSARSLLSLPESCLTPVSHNRGDDNAYADLWLMTQCRHFIIANSTFSWWGAWLADSSKKIVICPKQKSLTAMQGWGFSGLIPDTWMCL